MINLIEVQIKEFVESIRPPLEMRKELDIGYTFENNILKLLDVRPRWDDPSKFESFPFAKTNYVKAQAVWKTYWMRANGKWESYKPNAEVNSINDFFKLIEEDKYGCFFG